MTVTLDLVSLFRWFVIAAFAVAGIFIVVLLFGRVRGFFVGLHFERSERDAMRRRWREILLMFKAPGEVSLKMAVFEADKLLDQALKSLAMAGNTLGERLRFAEYKYPELRQVWWAHKVRNQLAHEATFHLDRGVAVKAVKAFGRALRRLGAI